MDGTHAGGWTFATIFTAGSGTPIEVYTTTGDSEEFGSGDNTNFFSNQNAIPIGPYTSGHVYNDPNQNAGTGQLPRNIFKNGTAEANNWRNPILGLDTRDGGAGILNGLPYWNMDFSMKKNIRMAESVSLELQGVFANVLNHTSGWILRAHGSILMARLRAVVSAHCITAKRGRGRSKWALACGSNHSTGGRDMAPFLKIKGRASGRGLFVCSDQEDYLCLLPLAVVPQRLTLFRFRVSLLLAVQQVVGNGTGGASDIDHRHHAFQFVVAGFVEEVADADHACGFSDEVDSQACRGAAEHADYRVQFLTAALQVGAGYGEVGAVEGRSGYE